MAKRGPELRYPVKRLLRLADETDSALRLEAARQKISVADLIRNDLNEAQARRENPVKLLAPTVETTWGGVPQPVPRRVAVQPVAQKTMADLEKGLE